MPAANSTIPASSPAIAHRVRRFCVAAGESIDMTGKNRTGKKSIDIVRKMGNQSRSSLADTFSLGA